MEFFEWMGITQGVFTFIAGLYLKEDTLELAKRNARLSIITGLIAGAVLFALCLVLGGIGLYRMAKKKDKKYPWLAFIPFANTFYAGYVAGEARFFGQKMKRAGLYAMIAEIVYVAFNILALVAEVLLIPHYTQTRLSSAYDPTYEYLSYGPTETSVPIGIRWLYYATYANSGFGWANILGYVSLLVYMVFLGVTLVALFKQYYPRGFASLTALCILFPVRGFVYFSLRKRTPVDYDAYMRRRMEEYARRQQQYGPYGQPPYGQPPYGQPPYGNQPYGQQPQSPQQDEPFSDFGGDGKTSNGQNGPGNTPPPSDDNPFSDF